MVRAAFHIENEVNTLTARCAPIESLAVQVKNPAAINIFPGDLLLKNFGVTCHDRVVFYIVREKWQIFFLQVEQAVETSHREALH